MGLQVPAIGASSGCPGDCEDAPLRRRDTDVEKEEAV